MRFGSDTERHARQVLGGLVLQLSLISDRERTGHDGVHVIECPANPLKRPHGETNPSLERRRHQRHRRIAAAEAMV
ncbi:hypothetical protein [Leifsonia sp. RAF41]|uniref:hypothetical protein n=1 Tax=Leifsonia sp. RAF41 TaxID=3233056 RepID=UPI003F980E15